MEGYARGNGHIDLAKQLNIPNAYSLAIGGSANSRIIRTTLKHSYQTTEPTLYILGLTFVSRSEIPILKDGNQFEGRWCNPQNQEFSNQWDYFWSKKLSEEFVRIKLITEMHSLLDRTEDLMYNLLAAIASLQSRGHRVLVYQQADTDYVCYLDQLKLFNNKNIINGFNWCAINFQHEQGVPTAPDGPVTFIGPTDVPANIKHRLAGAHQVLNQFLVNYIKENNVLED
jgi:hypothetical protein